MWTEKRGMVTANTPYLKFTEKMGLKYGKYMATFGLIKLRENKL